MTKWDNILLKNDIISKDDFFYFCIEEDQENRIIRECSKEEYKSFFKNKAYKEAFKNLQKKYINGEITLNELTLASAEVGAINHSSMRIWISSVYNVTVKGKGSSCFYC